MLSVPKKAKDEVGLAPFPAAIERKRPSSRAATADLRLVVLDAAAVGDWEGLDGLLDLPEAAPVSCKGREETGDWCEWRQGAETLVVANKADLLGPGEVPPFEAHLQGDVAPVLAVSALTGAGVPALLAAVNGAAHRL